MGSCTVSGPERPPLPLPVESVLPALVAAVRENRTALLRAPTGAGKTTRVPPALLDAGLAGDGAVIVLEPRRIAARAAARRMSEERGGELGGEVGYQVRFDRRAGKRTRILVVTEGVLVRMLQDDPFLEGIGAVVLDEFHERHLDTDLALAMLQRVRADARPDLALVVMSATFDAEQLAAWLNGAPIIESAGRLHPVDVRWAPRRSEVRLEESVARGVADVLERTEGDVLVFLPGVGEIRRAREALEPEARRRGLELRELYGDLAPEDQDATLAPRAPGVQRRVVLATNVAESSVTVPGVTAIVDTGLVRRMRFDPAVGLDRLELGRISRASADQRAGRAGRTAPGVCLRLWSELEHRALPASEEPELQRVDLTGTVLQLRAWGEPDVADFPWFEPPAERELVRASELLELLGALDRGRVTQAGQHMARLPVHPRLARLLLEGRAAGRTREAALMAALLSERDPFRVGRAGRAGRAGGASHTRRTAEHWSDSDVVDRLHALEGDGGGSLPAPDRGAARYVRRAADQLQRIGERGAKPRATPRSGGGGDDELRRWLFAAFPDRLARRRTVALEGGDRRAVMVGGRGVRLADESAVAEAELFVCVELDAGKGEALVRQASAVEREWLAPEHLVVREQLGYDADADRVRAVRQTCWRDLVLDEVSAAPNDPRELERVLAEAAAAAPDRALDLAAPEIAGYLARVRSLAEWRPELDLPGFDAEQLGAVAAQLVGGARSFADLRRRDPLPFLAGLLTREQAQALEREAPERIRVPSGSAIRLNYEPGRAPVLAARIQELFGLEETPRVAGGRVKVLMHLLAPNRRPQQVTDDLASFWSTTYANVRKELRRRYPKHSWPENPREGVAQRRPHRRRGS